MRSSSTGSILKNTSTKLKNVGKSSFKKYDDVVKKKKSVKFEDNGHSLTESEPNTPMVEPGRGEEI